MFLRAHCRLRSRALACSGHYGHASRAVPSRLVTSLPSPTSTAKPTPATEVTAARSPHNSALLLFCLSTGLVDGIIFTSSGVWCAFVTGSTVQLGMDLPTLFSYLYHHVEPSSALAHFVSSQSSQRLSALVGFLIGGWSAARAPASFTPTVSSAVQSALLASAASLVLFNSPLSVEQLPYPHLTLALTASSMALQAVLVQRFATPYATSVAWTSVWLSAVAPGGSGPRWRRFAGLSAVVGGAALGAGILQLGRDDDGETTKASKDTTVQRVGWGLAAAAAIKAVVAGLFWRRRLL